MEALYILIAILVVVAILAGRAAYLRYRQLTAKVEATEEDVLSVLELATDWLSLVNIVALLNFQDFRKPGLIDTKSVLEILKGLEQKDMVESKIDGEAIPLVVRLYRIKGLLSQTPNEPVLCGSSTN